MSNQNNNIAIVANNYGKSHDGIGAFSKVTTCFFSSNLTYKVYTSICSENDSKIKRFLTLGMTRCLIKCKNHINEYQGILIEYPFVEWNPTILIAFQLLRSKSRKKEAKIILSLHEYRRVNRLRKEVIRFMAKRCDLVLVSNKEMMNDIVTLNSNVCVRGIPTNIYGHATPKNADSMNKFVFFGLINGTKAFDEMLNGWDEFNKNNKYKLYIITGSIIKGLERHKNVVYIHNADNDTIFQIMNNCMYCVLPVKPQIDEKNATFKTGAIAGCICIGKFSEEFSKEDFLINMKNYTADDFYNAFNAATTIDFNNAIIKNEEAIKFGNKYNPQNISTIIEQSILHLLSTTEEKA